MRGDYADMRGCRSFGVCDPLVHAFGVAEDVDVFQDKQPRGLLGVIEFARATVVLPKQVVNIIEGLVEHDGGFGALGISQRRRLGTRMFIWHYWLWARSLAFILQL